MSLLDLHGPDIAAAAPLYVPPAPKPRRAWGEATALFRGAGEGLTQIGATIGAVLAQGDSAVGSGLEPNPLMGTDAGRMVSEVGAERRRQRDRDIEAIRAGGRSLRPDEAASTAEQVIYGMARSVTKVVGGAVAGGVPGILAVSAEEAFTQTGEARREGIDSRTAAALGLVQGAGLALAALPAAGQTFAGTAALYAAGGPGGFIAQQALTKEILDRAGYAQRAQQVDVLDPVGLAVSALVPAPFAVLGLRAARNRRAFESLRDVPLSTARGDAPAADGGQATAAAMSELPPFERTATAQAVGAYPREVTDAALVLNARHADNEAREAMAGGDMAASRAHDTALARAEEQIQRGEPVSVADVAPGARATDSVTFDELAADQPARGPAPLLPLEQTADQLRGMAEQAYWAQVGGSIVRDVPTWALKDTESSRAAFAFQQGDVVGRTTWIPAAEWFGQMRSDLGKAGLSKQADIRAAVEKAIAGGPLRAAETRTLAWMRQYIADMAREADDMRFVVHADEMLPDAFMSGLGKSDMPDLAATARAAQIDEAAVERAAIQFADDDAGFREAITRIIRDADAARQQAERPAEPAQQGADAGGGGAAPRAEGKGQAAGAAAGDAEQRAAIARLDAIAREFPDLTIKLDDGSLVRASEFLEAAKAEAARDAQEADLVDAAVQCALLHGT